MVAVELDQLRERLRIRLAGHRVRPVDIGFEIRRDVRLELAQESVELTAVAERSMSVGSTTVAPSSSSASFTSSRIGSTTEPTTSWL